MGGSFNPVHIGHLIIANEILFSMNLKKVLFIPAGNPPHKKAGELAPAKHRYKMLEYALENNSFFELSDIELKREGLTYSVDTVRKVKEKYPDAELHFISGYDSIIELPDWERPKELLSLCGFIAVKRPGYENEKLSEEIEKITSVFGGEIKLIEVPQINISSSEIRYRINNKMPVKYLVPGKVEKYIFENKLFIG